MATALNELTSMPKLPITSGVMSAAPAAPKGYMGPKEIAPAMEELRGEIGAAEQRVGQADIGIERAKREEKAAELGIKAESLEQQVKDIEAMPERAELKAAREKLKGMEFVPTRDTVQDIAGLFGLIGVVGMVVGKGDAMRAMHAMNGMMEGHRKGRQDLFKQQLQEFDKNFKAMQAKVSTALAEYQEALEIKKTNREAGELRKQEALLRTNSPLLKAMDEKIGEVGTLNALKGAKEDFGTMVKMRNDLQSKVEDRELKRLLIENKANVREEKALQAVGPALRSIAEQYPAGTVNTLVGASPDDKKKIQGSYRAIEESESAADFVARNPRAVVAVAVAKNFLRIDAIKSLRNEDEAQAAVAKSQFVDQEIDKAAKSGKISMDDAEAAKILQKKLFGLALSDVQGSGQRGSVYLDRQFQNLYDQASRQDTLLRIIRERAEENNRNLRVYKLNFERNLYPEQFPLLEADTKERMDEYRTSRMPMASLEDVNDTAKGQRISIDEAKKRLRKLGYRIEGD